MRRDARSRRMRAWASARDRASWRRARREYPRRRLGGMRTGDARARRHMGDMQRPAKSSGMRMAFCEIGDARELAAFRRRLVGIQRFVQKSCEISRHDLLKIVSGFSAEIHNDINRSVSIVPIERLEIVAPSSLPTDRRSVAWFACFASRVRWSCPPIVERRACVGPRILPVRRVAARDACPSESFGFLAVQAVHDSGLPVPRGSGGGSSGCCVVAGCRDKKWCLFT